MASACQTPMFCLADGHCVWRGLAQIHHTDILNTCVCGKHFPLMGQCVARILIEHSKALRSPPSLLLQIPISFLRGWWGWRGEGRQDFSCLSPSIISGATQHFSAVICTRFQTLYLDHLGCSTHEIQTHSILGDMETKGEKASVRKMAGGRVYWKRATVQVARNASSSLRPCAKSLLRPHFTSPEGLPGCRGESHP